MDDNNSKQQKKWDTRIKCAVITLCGIWIVYFCFVHMWFLTVVSAVAAVFTIYSFFGFSPIKIKNSGGANLKQEDDNEKDIKPNRCKIWWNNNLKWFFSIIVIGIVVSLFFIIGEIKNHKEVLPPNEVLSSEQNDSLIVVDQRQQFDNLVANFDYRMKQQLTYENAYQLLKDDYHVLLQMLQLLEENPKLTAASKYQYIDCFKNRVDTAILIINKAIYDTTLTSLESYTMSEKFIPQVKEIEQMRNNL